MSQLPLPEGWIQEFDPKQKHPFWVDTKAKPPRAIWVHPYEDEKFLSEHPDINAKVGKLQGASLEAPPPYEKRRHSFSGGDSGVPFSSHDDAGPSGSSATPSTDEQREERKRGVFAKLKDKTIGTKEERDAHKKQKEEEREAHKKQKDAEREAYRKRKAEQYAREEEERYGGHGYNGQYGPPPGDPYAYNSRRQGRSGFGGMGLPLLGGLAGGLLLGDMLDGGFGGGGFGGGDFGGGGFF
ncbi:hypothetical protein M405DRAFT_729170 [Rhizopogon salebrosus TDB-379]|nr:hypothetical protein M405DRAFT_729170 [Rhizopogon salebrosus TDB-379]